MAAKFSDLVTYFETIAKEHVDIKHSKTDPHFYRFELDEVLGGMCNNLKYPALVMEGYDFNFSDSNSDNIRKSRSGAFWLIDYVKDKKDYDAIHAAWDRMEEIGTEILVRMRTDKASRAVEVLRDFNIGESEGIPMSVMTLGQHGIRFTFSLTSAVSSNINALKWQKSL
jgi:hypothetical protein